MPWMRRKYFVKRNHFAKQMATGSSNATKVAKVKQVEVNGKIWTKDDLKQLLETNDAAVIKAMLKIFEYQTYSEQQSERTSDFNGVGFSGVDGEILSSFAKQFQTRGFLSPKQMAIARKRMKHYAGQLLLIMAGAITPPTS